MRKIWALVRASWIAAKSYRLGLLFGFGGIVVGFVPLYFAAHALQPVVEDSIRLEGQEYFGFLVVGLAVTGYLSFAMRSLPAGISSGIGSGTLEALLATPTRLPTLLTGLMGYPFLRTTARSVLLLIAMWLVGTHVAWGSVPLSAAILLLIVLAHIPIGMFAAALHLVFRTSGPLVPGILAAETLLGGVYYSTNVIPEVVRPLSAVVPLTYGLRALRRSLLSGESLSAVGTDVAILTGFTAVLLVLGLVAFRRALDYSRKAGTLAQY